MSKMHRREFLARCARLGIGLTALGTVGGCSRDEVAQMPPSEVPGPGAAGDPGGAVAEPRLGSHRWQAGPADVDIAVAQNMKPDELGRAAVEKYGGIGSWVKPGDVVAIKPNLAWARQPAQAATTSPGVLAAVIALCKEAGAKRIVVVEHSCDSATVTFDMSEAKRVCRELGVPLVSLENESMYQEVTLAAGVNIQNDQVATELLDCDVYINLPIVKAHSATVTTAALKNQMGVVWDRGSYHRAGGESAPGLNLHQNIVGLAVSLRPTLNIVDATRVLVTGGPKGPGMVEERNTVLVSADMVAADAYAATLLGLKPEDIPYIGLAAEAGIGKGNLAEIKVAMA